MNQEGEELKASLFFENDPPAISLTEYDGEYVESERACAEILTRYSESTGIKLKCLHSKRDVYKRQIQNGIQ